MSNLRVEVEHLPTITVFKISRVELWQKLNALPIKWRYIKLDDYWYFYCSWEDWGKVFDKVQSGLPSYREDIFDCDNFANLIMSKVARLFGMNTCARVDGWADVGHGLERHAWNIFFDGENFYQLESQKTGALIDIDDPKYKPDELVAG